MTFYDIFIANMLRRARMLVGFAKMTPQRRKSYRRRARRKAAAAKAALAQQRGPGRKDIKRRRFRMQRKFGL